MTEHEPADNRKLDAWKELADAQSNLLVCYRLNRRPTERLLDRLQRAKDVLRELGEFAR